MLWLHDADVDALEERGIDELVDDRRPDDEVTNVELREVGTNVELEEIDENRMETCVSLEEEVDNAELEEGSDDFDVDCMVVVGLPELVV